MGASKKEILSQLSELSSPSDVGSQLEGLMNDAAELNDPVLLQEIYNKGRHLAEKNYKANVVLWTCLAAFLDKKKEAHSLFQSTSLDDPEEFDDVYSDACRLLEICDCSEDEVDNLRRDAEAMFDEDGVFQSDWKDRL
jgi:hypothetical protein